MSKDEQPETPTVYGLVQAFRNKKKFEKIQNENTETTKRRQWLKKTFPRISEDESVSFMPDVLCGFQFIFEEYTCRFEIRGNHPPREWYLAIEKLGQCIRLIEICKENDKTPSRNKLFFEDKVLQVLANLKEDE